MSWQRSEGSFHRRRRFGFSGGIWWTRCPYRTCVMSTRCARRCSIGGSPALGGIENGAAAFERREDGRTRKLESKVFALQSKLAQKDEVIAEIMAAHVALKKVLERAEGVVGVA